MSFLASRGYHAQTPNVGLTFGELPERVISDLVLPVAIAGHVPEGYPVRLFDPMDQLIDVAAITADDAVIGVAGLARRERQYIQAFAHITSPDYENDKDVHAASLTVAAHAAFSQGAEAVQVRAPIGLDHRHTAFWAEVVAAAGFRPVTRDSFERGMGVPVGFSSDSTVFGYSTHVLPAPAEAERDMTPRQLKIGFPRDEARAAYIRNVGGFRVSSRTQSF